jgi:hypothetical protein
MNAALAVTFQTLCVMSRRANKKFQLGADEALKDVFDRGALQASAAGKRLRCLYEVLGGCASLTLR